MRPGSSREAGNRDTRQQAGSSRRKPISPRVMSAVELTGFSETEGKNVPRIRIVQHIETLFNQLWYHLYKVMEDTRLRKRESQGSEERKLLTDYAKRAVTLWSLRKQVPDIVGSDCIQKKANEEDAIAIHAIERGVRQLDEELQAVEFLDDAATKKTGRSEAEIIANTRVSQYRDKVLAALHLNAPEPAQPSLAVVPSKAASMPSADIPLRPGLTQPQNGQYNPSRQGTARTTSRNKPPPGVNAISGSCSNVAVDSKRLVGPKRPLKRPTTGMIRTPSRLPQPKLRASVHKPARRVELAVRLTQGNKHNRRDNVVSTFGTHANLEDLQGGVLFRDELLLPEDQDATPFPKAQSALSTPKASVCLAIPVATTCQTGLNTPRTKTATTTAIAKTTTVAKGIVVAGTSSVQSTPNVSLYNAKSPGCSEPLQQEAPRYRHYVLGSATNLLSRRQFEIRSKLLQKLTEIDVESPSHSEAKLSASGRKSRQKAGLLKFARKMSDTESVPGTSQRCRSWAAQPRNTRKTPTKRKLMVEPESAIDLLLGKCAQEQAHAQRDLLRTRSAKRRVFRKFRRMQSALKPASDDPPEQKREINHDVKHYHNQKFLFVYGSEGLGRFLTSRCPSIASSLSCLA